MPLSRHKDPQAHFLPFSAHRVRRLPPKNEIRIRNGCHPPYPHEIDLHPRQLCRVQPPPLTLIWTESSLSMRVVFLSSLPFRPNRVRSLIRQHNHHHHHHRLLPLLLVALTLVRHIECLYLQPCDPYQPLPRDWTSHPLR